MGTKRKRIEDKQLSRFIKFLSKEETDYYNLQDILAYSIVNSLSKLPKLSSDFEESRFQEIKQIYAGLETLLNDYRLNKKFNPFLEPSHKIDSMNWNDYKIDAMRNDSLIDRIYSEKINSHPKRLITYLNQVGFRLLNDVPRNPPYRGKRTAMMKDYAVLEEAFDLKVTQW